MFRDDQIHTLLLVLGLTTSIVGSSMTDLPTMPEEQGLTGGR